MRAAEHCVDIYDEAGCGLSTTPFGFGRCATEIGRSYGNLVVSDCCRLPSFAGVRFCAVPSALFGLLRPVSAASHCAPAPGAGTRGVEEQNSTFEVCASTQPWQVGAGHEFESVAGEQ